MPQALFEETERVVAELAITASVFYREAVEARIKDIKRKRLEQELEEGYRQNARFARKVNEEWSAANAPVVD